MDLEKTVLFSHELDEETYGQKWLKKKVIPESQTTILFGKEGSYKTQNGFQDIAETKQTGVLYLCLENHFGFKARVDAIKVLYPNAESIRTDKTKFNILNEEDVIDVTAYCIRYGIGLLVIDTLSR